MKKLLLSFVLLFFSLFSFAQVGMSEVATATGGYNFVRTAVAGTTTVKASTAKLHTITINTIGSGTTPVPTLTVYNSTTATGPIVAVINSGSGPITLRYGVTLSDGLTIVNAGTVAADITISYK